MSIEATRMMVVAACDPMFPPAHGEALGRQLPNARLLTLEGAGHGVDRADWETIVRAILEHTAVHARAGGR
jgi:pimeloyl-ACP methyl ester carboxylesterase